MRSVFTNPPRLLVLIVTFSVVLVFPLLFICYGLNFTDTPFTIRMINSHDPMRQQIWLTMVFGKLWEHIFNDNIISFRMLTVLSADLLIILVFFFFYDAKKIIPLACCAASSSILFFASSSFNYGYDLFTTVIVSLIFLSLITFIKYENLFALFTCGLLSFLAFLIRFPNIVIIPLVFLITGLAAYMPGSQSGPGKYKKLLRLITFWLLAFSGLVFSFCLFVLFMRDPGQYFSSLAGSLSFMEKYDHPISVLIKNYLGDGILVVIYVSVIFILLLGYRAMTVKWKMNSIVSGLIISLIYFIFLFSVNTDNFNLGLRLSITSFFIGLIASLLIQYVRQKQYPVILILVTAILLMFVPITGSDTGFLKCFTFPVIFLPLFITWLYESPGARIQKPFFTILLISLLLFGIYTRVTWFYGDSRRMTELSSISKFKKLSNIRTTGARVDLIEKVIKEVKAHTDSTDDIIFFGKAGQMFYYLLEKEPLPDQFFQLLPNDQNVFKQLSSMLIKGNNHPVIAIINGEPNNPLWPQYLLGNNRTIKMDPDNQSNPEHLIQLLLHFNYSQVAGDRIFSIYKSVQ